MSPHKGWKTQVHTRDVLRKIESQWKGGSAEIRELRVAASKEIAEEWGVDNRTITAQLKTFERPCLRSILAFDDLVPQVLRALRRLRASDPDHHGPELQALHEAWPRR